MASGSDVKVMDGVVASIGTYLLEHAGIVVADGADVILLGPAGLCIHYSLVEEERAAELFEFPRIGGYAHKHLLEDQLNLNLLVISRIEVLQAVV